MPISATSLTIYETENIFTEEELRAIQFRTDPFLYYTLMSLIEGSAYTILEQVEEENGCEAY